MRRASVDARRAHQAGKDPRDGLWPWLWAMQDADEAERRGDAAAALAVMDRRWIGPDGKPFWRPSRRRWLEQVVAFGPDLPGWARSRWLLEQARQYRGEPGLGRSPALVAALGAAAEVRGGLHLLRGRTSQDRELDLMDFDWVCRQYFLYDGGGLAQFLRSGAAPDLVSGADRIREWADAPMRGLQYLGRERDVLWWRPAGSVEVVSTPNTGTAVTLHPDDHVLARLVPTADGPMVDGPPLEVPVDVAVAVEADPAAWVDVLRGATARVQDGTIEPRHAAWRGLLSDLPFSAVEELLDHCPDPLPGAAVGSAEARAHGALELATRTLVLEAASAAGLLHGERAQEAEQDLMALVHAAFTDPAVVEALPGVVTVRHLDLLADLGERLAEPSCSVALTVLEGLRRAA